MTSESMTETLRSKLRAYLESIDGPGVPVPVKQTRDGVLNVKGTLELPCYQNFPDREAWLAAVNR